MIQQQVFIINSGLMVLDVVCVILAGYGAYFIKMYLSGGAWSIDTGVFVASVLFVMFLNNYLMGKFHLYSDTRRPSNLSLWWSILKAIVICFVFLSSGVFLFKQLNYSRIFFIYFAVLSFVLIAINRVLVQICYYFISKRGFNLHRILVVGDIERGKIISKTMASQLSWGHKVVGQLSMYREDAFGPNILGCFADFHKILLLQTIDEVIFAMGRGQSTDLSKELDLCKKMGISVRILPSLWQFDDRNLSMEICQGIPFLTIKTSNFNALGLLTKRVLDIVGGVAGTLIFLIIYPFVATVIKLDSPGPVLFKQKRMGQHRRVFELYKFRSMYQDSDGRKQELSEMNEMSGALFKLKNDPRITRAGKFLRKTSLDEFPQFLNVLKGEMSLVGTRPPTLDEVEKYKTEHLKRISAKPGITGLWQVSGRNQITDFEEVVALDCKYLDNWRFLNDIEILLKTIFVIIQRKGAV
jgi:exopolysaccharide biosynthesis polyprenyl glycosylphosphotransferase